MIAEIILGGILTLLFVALEFGEFIYNETEDE